jgi:hypothetical protein
VLWNLHLLGGWQPTISALILLASVVAVVGLLFGEWFRRAVAISLVATTMAVLGGSATYAVSRARNPHTGSIPGGDGTTTNNALTALLKATTTRWAAATTSALSAAPLQLASGRPVIAIGGFNGGDNAPTLTQFQALRLRERRRGEGQGEGASSAIATWVAAHCTATAVGGTTVYDLAMAAT